MEQQRGQRVAEAAAASSSSSSTSSSLQLSLLQPQQRQQPQCHGPIVQELYFLIAKFLSQGPLRNVSDLIISELEHRRILPPRLDWLGAEHTQSFAELEYKYQHISPEHLLQICNRMPGLLEQAGTLTQPSVAGIASLLGAGRQSMLRTPSTIVRAKSLRDHCTRLHAQPLAESLQRRANNNIVHVLLGRQMAGPLHRRLAVPSGFYEKLLLLRRTLGHLSAVYCVLFDRSGKYIITGADDLLVKLWSAIDGRLLTTFRGASAEITDIAVNLDNTLLAAGSLDRILRVWDLQTAGPIAVLSGHTGMITSVNFCPSPRAELKYLVTTSTDGSVAFWQYGSPRGGKAQFAAKPIQYHEKLRPGQAQMICASFSPGGVFLAAGSADHHVRVYLMAEEGPKRILETEAHTDTVDSIQWAHSGLRFVSGSKDGMAHVWNFEAQQWRPLKLNMSDRLSSCPVPEDETRKLKVTMVSWDFSDRWVITAVNDFTIKVWNASTGKLHRVMRGHTDELYVLESHPKDPHVLISAGHDGQLFVWNILDGVAITSFVNNIDGQGHGGVFDAKWSPDGSMIAATDSHGHILMYGFGSGHQRLKMLPKELFFHTDYRPLMRDANHFVMDEQTQTIPHLMPPPFLVDVDGNPHPPAFQRLVPGREACTTEQLVPNITMGPEGVEVVDSANNTVSNIDRLIAVLANRQGPVPPGAAGGGNGGANGSVNGAEALQNGGNAPIMAAPVAGPSNPRAQLAASVAASPRSVHSGYGGGGGGGGRGEGVRQSSGNWEREQNYKWIRRTYVRPMQYWRLQALRLSTYVTGQQEHEIYKREMRRRPMMINTGNASTSGGAQSLRPAHPKRRPVRRAATAANGAASGHASHAALGASGAAAGGVSSLAQAQAGPSVGPTPAYRTRAVREREHPPSDDNSDDPDHMASASSGDDSNDSTAAEDLMSGSSSSSGDSDSSDYSDWVANDQPGQALEPPQRSKRKPVQARQFSPSSSPERRSNNDEHDDDGVNVGASTSRGSGAAGSSTARTTNGTTNGGAQRRRTNGAGGSRRSNGRRAPQRVQPIFENGEIPERFRPPEWLSEVIPRKAPYYPQMGDDVVYFRQGHHRYLEAVRSKNVYKVPNNSEPWHQLDLRDSEPVKVIGIKYEIRPPRLCCLKLALLNNDGSLQGQSFTIKYHDMPDVLDFIVLKQTYETAVRRLWTPSDRFRCMIDDSWWTGCIESRTALSPEFPTSLFMCFRTRWDNGEYEAMSPWDMEPIDQNRLPEDVGGQVPVTAEELRATLYQPKSEEWPRGDRDATCRRIVAGLEEVMGLAIADPFLVPVDLNTYPSYAFMVEYPIDLTTIKARFENHFYRRLTSAQFDVRYLATNAEKFNQSNSSIVKHARIITDLCLRIIKDQNEVDVGAVYHQLMDTYVTSDSDADTEVGAGAPNASRSGAVPSTSAAAASTSAAAAAAAAGTSSSAAARRSTRSRPNEDWQSRCRTLLEMIWARQDSTPFREPVDLIEHPDYLASVDTPMDLQTIKEDLRGGNYHSINEFVNDMRLIFSNSRNYNTNKRSRIYSMTLRLSNLFEAQLKALTGKSSKRRMAAASVASASSPRDGAGPSTSGGGGNARRRRVHAGGMQAGPSNGAGPSGSSHHAAHPSHSHSNHGASHATSTRSRIQAHDPDSDSDCEEYDILDMLGSRTNSTNNLSVHSGDLPASHRGGGGSRGAQENGGFTNTASSSAGIVRSSRRRLHDAVAVASVNGGASTSSAAAVGSAGPSTSSASRTATARRAQSRQQPRAKRSRRDLGTDDEDDDEEEEEDDDDDDDSESASTTSEESNRTGHRTRRHKRRNNRIASDASHSANDSEESYNPTASKRIKDAKRKAGASNNHPTMNSNNAAANDAPVARPVHLLNGGGRAVAGPSGSGASTSAASVAAVAGPSSSSGTRRNPTGRGRHAASSDEDEDEDDDDYQAEEDEEEEEEVDDANDEDYNVNSTPKKSVRSSAQKSRPKSTGKKPEGGGQPAASSGSDDNGRRRSARKPAQQQRYESDHSYHLNASTSTTGSHKRRIQLDTEEEEDGAESDNGVQTVNVVDELSQDGSVRPRRNAAQRSNVQQLESARTTQRRVQMRTRSGDSDSLDEPLAVMASGSASQNSNSSAAAGRSLRSTRSAVSQEEDNDDDDDDESDDQVLSQLSNGYRSRGTAATTATARNNDQDGAIAAIAVTSPMSARPNRGQPSVASTATSSGARIAAVAETTRNRQLRQQIVQEDHNYDEPGPSALRHPRRTAAPLLSRHQRNADELDPNPLQPAAASSASAVASPSENQMSGRLRRRPTPPTNTGSGSSASQEAMPSGSGSHHHLRTRFTASQEASHGQHDDSDDDDDIEDDDNRPLRFMAASSQQAAARQQRPRRQTAPSQNETSQHGDETTAMPSSSRSTRTQKRPYYNEDSDEDAAPTAKTNASHPPNKRLATMRNNHSVQPAENPLAGVEADDDDADDANGDDDEEDALPLRRRNAPRSQRQQIVDDDEDDDDVDVEVEDEDDDEEDGAEPSFSVSSRGRVRRITAKARGLFRE